MCSKYQVSSTITTPELVIQPGKNHRAFKLPQKVISGYKKPISRLVCDLLLVCLLRARGVVHRPSFGRPGKTYYYNSKTHQTSWVKPAAPAPPPGNAAAAAAAAAGGAKLQAR